MTTPGKQIHFNQVDPLRLAESRRRKRNKIRERMGYTGTYHEARGVDWLLVQDGSVLVGNRSYNDLETALATEV
jgi:hypothetical protein